MKYLKMYENMVDEVTRICSTLNIHGCIVHEDGNVSAQSADFYRDESIRRTGKLPIKFNKIEEFFIINECCLTTLEGCPKVVGGDIHIRSNKGLKTLIGGPSVVEGEYGLMYNGLLDFYGFPKEVKKDIYFHGNPVDEILMILHNLMDPDRIITEEMIEEKRFINFLNEFDVIREGKYVSDYRLDQALYMTIGKRVLLEDLKLNNYTII